MNFLVFVLGLFLLAGCGTGAKPRQYTELATQTPQAPQEQMADAATQAPQGASNPHAGIDMSANITPDARANLQKMLAQGQDPHAGINMSDFMAGNPHAGLENSAMAGEALPSPYTWIIPQGWKQGPAKMMRLVSFYKEGAPDAFDCYIVALPGTAGGQEANLKRWMGQVDIDPSDANYQKLLDNARTIQTQGGLQARFYDLTLLQQEASDKSMIAAIIATGDTTIFVKMTGTRAHVKQNQKGFLELLKSLGLKP
ncbi:MAG: hypothetical protein KGJ09_01190 [Candidatus Omnitrophica bacterium]|nr:hypothetical protein [Candidatus Omnitrophota bacterium]